MPQPAGFEIFIPVPNSKWNEGVMLQKYGDGYSLISARTGSDGQNYMRWCFPQDKDRKPLAKSLPWKIGIGNRLEAIEILRKCLTALEGAETTPELPPAVPSSVDDDIPF